MDAKIYQTQFDRTCADVFFPQNVSPIFVGMLLAGRKQTAKLIDAAKRGLFYDKPDRLGEYTEAARNDFDLPFDAPVDVIHAILGMEGEVTEISEAALDDTLSDEQRRAKVIDEAGDTLWYMALMFRHFGITFDEVFAANIAKLAKRYPEKFTTDAAVNRDLEGESNVLQFAARRKPPVSSTGVLTSDPNSVA
jgi:NTP pyrophosphatase (non-canonical NTP hydrolase)